MKKIFVNPTVQVLGVEVESQILAGSGGNITTAPAQGGGTTPAADKQDPTTGTDGLARPMGTDISAYELK
ncbi:MAG: hypothetical protein J5630_04675 [Bacteroidaceae bacterium]|nr:hypothetical protein [Bacteroidaceae bacterium]